MTKHLKSMLLIGALALFAALGAPSALAAEACPNEQLRAEDNSTLLPDCRAYELVSSDSNHAYVNPEGRVNPSNENEMLYSLVDAPEHGGAGGAIANAVRAERDPVSGWSGLSLSPPLDGPATSYQSFFTIGVSADLTSTLVWTTQPLDGQPRKPGFTVFLGPPGGPYRALTPVASGTQPEFLAGATDFNHVYFVPHSAQLPSDPVAGSGPYSWSQQRGLRLVGILPGGVPAPNGAAFVGASEDGVHVAFRAEEKLYVRTDESQTVEVSATQRTVNPDPNPPPEPKAVLLTADGSKILFTSSSELTNDANTGESAGVATDTGRDLYSYDIATGVLTDLTVDTNPADIATGADIQAEPFNQQTPFVKSSPDGSYVYFVAAGDLAPGATPGHDSLYVWHDGQIDFVARAEAPPAYVTPDGRHALLESTERLTGYDNTDPVTGQPHIELFEASLGAALQCVTCRINGTRPTGEPLLPVGSPTGIISDDGRRVFFGSTDAVVPQASSGLRQVFEFHDGTVSAISPLDSTTNADLLVASPSGNDVFFKSFENLVPNPNSGPAAVIDARVGGGFPLPAREHCPAGACQGPPAAAPAPQTLSSGSFSGSGNLSPPLAAPPPTQRPLTRAQKLARALKACRSKHNKRRRAACQKKARRAYPRTK